MTELQIIEMIYSFIPEKMKDEEDEIDAIRYNKEQGIIIVEFHDGKTPKKLTISTNNIGLDYGGHFTNKGYNTQGGN